MANEPPKISIEGAEKRKIGNDGTFSASVARLGAELGMKGMGCSLVELEPGKRAWPFHLHYGQEELFIILEGSGTLRYDDGEYEIAAGELFYAGTGPGTAHQIVNSSDAPLKYLALSTSENPEICYYPDSKKFGSYSWTSDDRLMFMAHEDSRLGYFDGEE